jgi:hypothetical protein
MRNVSLFFLSAFISIQLQANTVSLTDKSRQIDLNQALILSTDLKNICGQAFKGQQAFTCKSNCGRLFDRLQDLSTTLARPKVKKQAVTLSAKGFYVGVQSCGKVWPNNQAPLALKPFVDLAMQIQQGKIPKSASAQANQQGGSAVGFANKAAPTRINSKPVWLTPFVALDQFVSNANLPYRCKGFGNQLKQCQVACTPVKIAAYELRDLVNREAGVATIRSKAVSIDQQLKSCATYLPSTTEALVEARKFNHSLLEKPDQFAKWRALGRPPINAENDKNPASYLNMVAAITQETLKFCGRASLQKCSPACETLAASGKTLQQASGDLVKQRQALDAVEKYSDYCGKNNVSPFLPAIKELAKHVKSYPEFLYTDQQLSAVNKNLQDTKKQGSVQQIDSGVGLLDVPAYPLSTGYVLTPLNTGVRNRLADISDDLISTAGAVDHKKALQAISHVSKNSCKNIATKECGQACKVVYSYALGLERNQASPGSSITREKPTFAVGVLPRGALTFLDKAAICLNSLDEHKVFDDNVKTLLQYYAFIKSAEPPKQPAPTGYVFYASRVELQQKVAHCKAGENVACVLSCKNALSVSKVMVSQEPVSRLSRLAELEVLLDGYIDQCQSSYLSMNIVGPSSIGNKWSMLLKEKDFSSLVDVESIKASRKKAANQQNNIDQAYQFISQYQPEVGAPVELKVVERNTRLSFEYKTVMDALLTIQNYCPETGDRRGCPAVEPRYFLGPVTDLYDAGGIINNLLRVLNNFVNTLGRSDNAESDRAHKRSGYRLYHKYQALSPAIRPAKFQVIDQFVEDILAMNPSVIVSNNHRFYCGEKGRQQNNPFLAYDSCEFLSAIYYRDFERLVALEKLWVEPVLKKQAEMTEGQNNIVYQFLAKQNRSLLDNSEKTSMMPLVISSYLIDYNSLYGKCIKPDAKVYRYQDNKVTDFKNRYGHTLYSTTSSNTRTYQVNRDWADIFDGLGLRLSAESVGMFTLIDSFHEGSNYTKVMELEYNAKRPSARDVLTDLGRFMKGHQCDSLEARKLDSRLQEFSNFRTALGKIDFR